MPRIHAMVPQGLSPENKETLIFTLADTVSETLKRPRSIVRVFIDEYALENFSVDGISYAKRVSEMNEELDVSNSDILITLYIMAGRTPAQKQELVEAITDAVEAKVGYPRAKTRIYFMDLPAENFAVNGMTSARKKELGQ